LVHVWAWLRAVGKHWKRELFGAVLIGLLALFSELTGIAVASKVYEVAAVVVLFYAMFLAWRDEHRQVEVLERSASQFSDIQLRRLLALEANTRRLETDSRKRFVSRLEAGNTAPHSKRREQRTITADQWSAMQASFQSAYGAYGDIVVQIPHGDPEAKRYGEEFADFFQSIGAGGAKLCGGFPPIPEDFAGVSIRYASQRSKPSTVDCLARALKAGQIRHNVESMELPPRSESYCILAIGHNG
jgi:hypothetical protein